MLYFLDIETTGLDDKRDPILEIACIAWDGKQVVDQTEMVIQPKNVWQDRLSPYVRAMHTQSGLLADIDSGVGISCGTAEKRMIDFIEGVHHHYDLAEPPIIAGFSIHFDRRFIRTQMPALDDALHHRMFDVTTIKQFIAYNWPQIEIQDKAAAHRAWADAKEALDTYRYFVEQVNLLRHDLEIRTMRGLVWTNERESEGDLDTMYADELRALLAGRN